MNLLTIFLLIALLLALLFLALVPMLPSFSYPDYVCRHFAYDTQKHFARLGIDSTIVVGKMSWSTNPKNRHAWVVVHFLTGDVAYEWGLPVFGNEYYQGRICERVCH